MGYAPPEQYQGQSEPRSDVYALASTLYHLATDDDPRGHPFTFPRLPALAQGLWAALDAALQQDVHRRPTAAQLRGQLEALLAPANVAEPIHLRGGGAVAHDVAELAQACDQHWDDGKFHLYRGDFEERLRKWGRTDLEGKTAVLRKQFVNQDVGLDAFIRLLDPAYPPSAIQVTPAALDPGSVPWGEQRTAQIEVRNIGRGCLQVRIVGSPPWLKTDQSEFAIHERQTVRLTFAAGQIAPQNQAQVGQLALDAGPGGQAQVALRISVPEPQVTVAPAALRLGAAYRGETRTAGLTVSNQGGSPCDVTVAGGADWAKITPDHFRCASGKSVAVTIAADTSRMGIGTHRTAVLVTAEVGGWRQETPMTAEVELPWLKTFAWRYRKALAVLAIVVVLLAAWGGVQLQKQLTYNRGQDLLATRRWEEAQPPLRGWATSATRPDTGVGDVLSGRGGVSGRAAMGGSGG